MRVKQGVAVALSALLALFIRLYQLLTSLIFRITSSFQPHSATNRRIVGSWANLGGDGAVCECIHVVGNSSLSLMLAFGVLHYHEHFVQLVVLVSHQVHRWFLQLIADVPDFSNTLRSSYTIKLVLCHLYLVFGYMGLSAQVTLTVDLIYLCNLPTIALYKLLAKVYQFLLKYFWILVELLTNSEHRWLSCPYPSWMLQDSCKVVYICCLPVFTFLMVVVAFYYIWLTFVIVALKIVMNISLNIALLIDQLGFVLCTLKGIDMDRKSAAKGIFLKMAVLKERFCELQWRSIFQPSMFLQIFKGNDLLIEQTTIEGLAEERGYMQIYNKLRSLIR